MRPVLNDSSHYREKIDAARENLDDLHNVIDGDNQGPAEWMNDSDRTQIHGFLGREADAVYSAGCGSTSAPLHNKFPWP